MKQSLPVPLSVIFHEDCTGAKGDCAVVGGRAVLSVLDGTVGVVDDGVVTLPEVAVDCPSVEGGVVTTVVVVGGGVVVVVVVTVVAGVVVVGNAVVVAVDAVEESVEP